MTSFKITHHETEDSDWSIGDDLTAYTKEKGGPDYAPLNLTFNAFAGGERVASAIVERNQGMMTVDLNITAEGERGKGYGTGLMRHVENFAKAAGDLSIFLTTPTWQGVGFYEKLGYKEMGRLPKHAGNLPPPQYEVFYGKEL